MTDAEKHARALRIAMLTGRGYVGAPMRETVTKATEGSPAHARAVTGDEMASWSPPPPVSSQDGEGG